MGSYPQDFPPPADQGGPGQGQPVGGFGGNPSLDRSGHRAAVQRVGKAPVLLIHGNAGAAETTRWDMLDLKRMLTGAGYPDEIIWAPSYLGAGVQDNESPFARPHTNNVNEVREFIDRVCAYLNVEVVDVIAHSLGCSLVYAICRGLEKRQPPPVNFNQPKQWQRLGTLVALAGAFHGLSPPNCWGRPKGVAVRPPTGRASHRRLHLLLTTSPISVPSPKAISSMLGSPARAGWRAR
jgi:pimeloyl-ACP methyl ester carboxylesterase